MLNRKDKNFTYITYIWCIYIYTIYIYVIYVFHGSDGKDLIVMWDTQVQFLGWEDLLEKGMATYSSILT